jgi:hypothetical protein
MVTERTTMSISAKKEYLSRVHGRYQRAGREHKGKILDEFCAVCGYHRKSALRLLRRPLHTRHRRKPGPKRKYESGLLLTPLKQIWLSADQPCSKLLKAALPIWVKYLPELKASVEKDLLAMSPATLDRLLKPVRMQHKRRGLSTTRPGKLLRHQVPLRDGPANTRELGHIEADTVAHCGDTVAGDFIYSLTFTDVCTGWTEIRATWNKSSQGILAQLKDIEGKLPFKMKTFHADNGSEFLNWPLWNYLNDGKRKVNFTRSRAYRKNDNAHVEQKNWTHVRQLFGHDRYEHAQLVSLMNEIYGDWNQLLNHFRPTFKLLSKEKKGSRYKRCYETPQTPYARLIQQAELTPSTKHQLKLQHQTLNPFELKKTIEQKLKTFFTSLSNLNREATNA